MQDWLRWYLKRSAEHYLNSAVNLTSLIPSLNSGGDGVQNDSDVENSRVLPLARDLLSQDTAVLIVKLVDMVDVCRALCHESTFQNVWSDVIQIVGGSEFLHALNESLLGNTDERILDSAVN